MILQDCSWTVFAPLGNRINVTFSHFDVEDPHTNGTCTYDFVELAEKEFEEVGAITPGLKNHPSRSPGFH